MTTTQDAGDVLAGLAVSGELPGPGSWKAALNRADAPGAVLDGMPWARSWGTYMRAVTDPGDDTARQQIANAMTRPRNAGFSESVPAQGGFLVPETLRSEVMAYMTEAIVRPQAMVLASSSLRYGLPSIDNSSQASGRQALGGLTFGWTETGAPIAASSPQVQREVMEARKLAALLSEVPNELVDDAAGALGDLLARVIGRGLAWTEDDAFICSGTGAGEPEALAAAGCALTVQRQTSDEVVLADVVGMLKGLHPAAKQAGLTAGVPGVGWLISSAVLDQILEMYLTVGTAPASAAVTLSDWLQLGDGTHTSPSLLGIPAAITDHQPAVGTTGDMILADLRNYVIADRMEMLVETSPRGAGFGSATTSFRTKARLDGRYWIRSQTTTSSGQQVSPVVVLGQPA
jgi:HK97 family phage major capsid protein